MLDMLKKLNIDINTDSDRYTYNGINVPRVTSILSETSFDERLMYWSNGLGFKRIKYKDALNKASHIGTRAHEAAESIISDKEFIFEKDGCFDEIANARMAFLQWWEMINANCTVRVLGMEEKLSCPWFGGTYDILLEIDGKVWLIDLKTSNQVDYKHFLQLSAYRYMIYQSKNINIDGCIILQLNKKEGYFTEYTLHFDNLEHYNFIETCINEFFALTYAYLNREHVKQLYKNIFGGRK